MTATIWILVLYFIPTIVAAVRTTKHGAGIMVINFFLGWTFIGWVIALAWAVCDSKPEKKEKANA